MPGKRKQRIAFVGVGLTILFFIGRFITAQHVTTSLMAPNQRYRAVLLDRPRLPSIDRNFHIVIEDANGGSQRVFQSPDEAPAGVGTERFLWSKDSSKLLLVGKRFYTIEGVELENGERLYVLYDVSSGKVWCNSDQRGPPFSPAELEGFDFDEPLTLKQ